MTDLDTRAQAATRELLDLAPPDVPTRHAELRRIRARRTTAKLVAVAAAVALAAGGWQLAGSPDRRPQPAPKPAKVVNGTLIAAWDEGWRTLSGEPLPNLPHDGRAWSSFQFTPDGASVVFPDRENRVSIADLATGAERPLAGCRSSCLVGLSPDGRVLAFAAGRSVELLTTDTGHVEVLPVPGSTAIGQPVWSPDGTMLAFADPTGLFVMNADGSGARLLHPSSDPVGSTLPPSWSPDSRSLAFFDAEPVRPGGGKGKVHDDRFTVEVAALAGGAVTEVHDAGHCYCLGLSPPALTWSPDGELIAVAATHGLRDPGGSRAPGVYVVHPDGSGWQLLAAGYYRAVAWQPLSR